MYHENAIVVELRFANQSHDKILIAYNACASLPNYFILWNDSKITLQNFQGFERTGKFNDSVKITFKKEIFGIFLNVV